MPHVPLKRGAWLKADQSVPGSKRIGRASHKFDGKAATSDVWKRVTAEQHQIRITLVDPKGNFCFAIRIAELHLSEAIRVPLKVCKCVVELCRTDPFWLSKVVFRSLHGLRPDRKAALPLIIMRSWSGWAIRGTAGFERGRVKGIH